MSPLTRRGTSLVESVVALLLASVLLSAAARGLLTQQRWANERARASDAAATTRDVVALMRHVLDHAASPPVLLADTAVQVGVLRLATMSCDAAAGYVAVPNTASWSAPRTGDSIGVTDSAGRRWHALVMGIVRESPSSRCTGGGSRLVPSRPLVPLPPAGRAPVRVWRVARYVLYRGNDAQWWLGERACAPLCSAAQPITGPLRPPAEGGVRLALVLSPSGTPLAIDVRARAQVGSRQASATARIPLIR